MQGQVELKSPRVGTAFVPSRGPRLPLQRVPPVGVGARRQDKGRPVCPAFFPSRWARTPHPHPATRGNRAGCVTCFPVWEAAEHRTPTPPRRRK